MFLDLQLLVRYALISLRHCKLLYRCVFKTEKTPIGSPWSPDFTTVPTVLCMHEKRQSILCTERYRIASQATFMTQFLGRELEICLYK